MSTAVHRIFNFSAGPAVLPQSVLEEAQRDLVALPGVGVIPVQFILALPYVLTVLLLAGFVGRAVPPRAIGVPYAKDR